MTKKSEADKDKKLLQLGKDLQALYEIGYVSRKRMLGYSFLKGLATGAGAFIGGTVVVALIVWGLGLFEQVPLIGDFLRAADSAINQSR
jgi:hypothetical protein